MRQSTRPLPSGCYALPTVSASFRLQRRPARPLSNGTSALPLSPASHVTPNRDHPAPAGISHLQLVRRAHADPSILSHRLWRMATEWLQNPRSNALPAAPPARPQQRAPKPTRPRGSCVYAAATSLTDECPTSIVIAVPDFRDRPIQPLSHLSKCEFLSSYAAFYNRPNPRG